MLLQSYQSFFKLILEEKKSFIYLLFFLLLEIFIISSNIILTIPLADYLLNPELNKINIITKKFLNILEFFNLPKSLTFFFSFFVFVNFVKAIMTITLYYYILKIKYEITYSFTQKLLKTIFNSNWNYFINLDLGTYLNSFTKVISNISNGFQEVALQISFFTKIIIYLTIPLLLDWKITVLTILISVFIGLPFKYLNKYAHYYGIENLKYDNYLLKNLSESFNASKIIFSYGLQNKIITNILNTLANTIKFSRKSGLISIFFVYLFQPIGIFGASIAFLIFYEDKSQLPELAAIFWSLVSGIPIISNLMKGNFQIINLEPNLKQYKNFINNTNNLQVSNKGIIVKKFENSIDFKNVNFQHNNKINIFKNINFKIYKNEFILIKGRTGIGKSTIIDLIMGFNFPSSGQIFFDKFNYKEINLNSLRSKIGYVPQEPILFNDTILNNLKLFKLDPTNKDLKKAIEKSNCQFIFEKDEGLNTYIGERGNQLSGGEKQRISLCRSILFNPEILILDEPTSSLDENSSRYIYSSLEKLKGELSCIVVSHENINENIFDSIYEISHQDISKLK